MPSATRSRPSRRSLFGLDVLNFTLADVQTGVGPFLAIFLATREWDEQRVGVALTFGGIAGIIAQTPAGALVDALHAKRMLIAIGVSLLGIGALAIAIFPAFWPVIAAQTLIGASSAVFGPAICAISLGLVGRKAFAGRQGRNQTFNAAGNVVAALTMGLLGYFASSRGVLVFVAALAIPAILSLRWIRGDEIDHDAARGDEGHHAGIGLRAVFQNRALVVFLVCAVMFHFANAAMLPLVGEELAKGRGRTSMMFMSACVITTQVVVAATSSTVGKRAASWGRKPLLLIAFAALPLRGVIYTMTSKTIPLVLVQILDGVGASIFGVVSVLVISDLTRGTGRFNLALGAISTAVGIGAALSQSTAGVIVHHVGSAAGFGALAAIATIAFVVLVVFMPETQIDDGCANNLRRVAL